MSTQYKGWLQAAGNEYGVSPDLLTSIMLQESGGNPYDSNGQPLTSPAGAIGLMQFMPDTARGLGIDPKDPKQSIYGAAQMMAQLSQHYGGDMRKAVAAYNWGQGNVDRAVANYGDSWLDYAPAETRNYVVSVLGQ